MARRGNELLRGSAALRACTACRRALCALAHCDASRHTSTHRKQNHAAFCAGYSLSVSPRAAKTQPKAPQHRCESRGTAPPFGVLHLRSPRTLKGFVFVFSRFPCNGSVSLLEAPRIPIPHTCVALILTQSSPCWLRCSTFSHESKFFFPEFATSRVGRFYAVAPWIQSLPKVLLVKTEPQSC